jgi:hypothetical protein
MPTKRDVKRKPGQETAASRKRKWYNIMKSCQDEEMPRDRDFKRKRFPERKI